MEKRQEEIKDFHLKLGDLTSPGTFEIHEQQCSERYSGPYA